MNENRNDWVEKLSIKHGSRNVFRFWQPGGGFDYNVFRDHSIPTIIEYIHANPVRRGLCSDPRDWTWSSARFWDGDEDALFAMDHPDDIL
ncbi:MAG: hypothetical protein AB7N71_03325 [Phycisphaerae bacterium]